MAPSVVLSHGGDSTEDAMDNPQQRDDQEDPATPTPEVDPICSENEPPAHECFLENEEITSLIENWIDA